MKNKPDIHIEHWKGSRFWAVYVDGELLTITVYKRGALALRERLLQLSAA